MTAGTFDNSLLTCQFSICICATSTLYLRIFIANLMEKNLFRNMSEEKCLKFNEFFF